MAEGKRFVNNEVKVSFSARKENVMAVRLLAAALASQIGFTLSEIEEIKVAVSEGVSNAIIHGYGEDPDAFVNMEFREEENSLSIIIEDKGCGIEDVEKALTPAFSTVAERMGLGFVFMQSFMDTFSVDTALGQGTTLHMKKYVSSHDS